MLKNNPMQHMYIPLFNNTNKEILLAESSLQILTFG